MKKIVAGFMAICMLFAVTACGNGSAQSVEVGSAETMTENSEALTDSESNTEIVTSPAAEGMYTYTIYSTN